MPNPANEKPEILVIPEGEVIEARNRAWRLKEEAVVESWDEAKDERVPYG